MRSSRDLRRAIRSLGAAAVLVIGVDILAAGCGSPEKEPGDGTQPVTKAEPLPSPEHPPGRGRDERRERKETPSVAAPAPGTDGKGQAPPKDGGGPVLPNPAMEALNSEVAKIQSSLEDLKVQVGDLKNFEESARGDLEKGKTAAASLEGGLADSKKRIGDVEKSLKDLAALRADLQEMDASRKKHKDEHVDLDERLGKIPEMEESLGKAQEEIDGLKESVGFLKTGKADRDHLEMHDAHYVKVEAWRDWLEKDYKAAEPWWRHVAVAVSAAVLTGAAALFLALKAVKPAYRALNELRMKVNQILSRETGAGGPPAEE